MHALVALALLAAMSPPTARSTPRSAPVRVVVLGIAQDGGVPHAGCTKKCCTSGRRVLVSSLAIVDENAKRWWLVDATPDITLQLQRMRAEAPACTLAGVLLTHAHIGHYTGLMHFGREVMGAHDVFVYAMPRMREYLASNGPWEQLVRLRNIALQPLAEDSTVALSPSVRVTPFRVPHRDEYSETVGFRIVGPTHSVVFVPDIDKWERWSRPLEDLVRANDVLYLDGTFYDGSELPGRDLSEVPHPLIRETMERLAALPAELRDRVRFIHLNHTNPALFTPRKAPVAREGESVPL